MNSSKRTHCMCESHWDTDRYFKIRGRFVNNQKIIGRTYSPPKRQHGPRVSSFCLTIEKSWHKMKPTDGFYAMTTNCCRIKCMDDIHVHMRLKRKFIFETLFFYESISPAVPVWSPLSSMSQESILHKLRCSKLLLPCCCSYWYCCSNTTAAVVSFAFFHRFIAYERSQHSCK